MTLSNAQAALQAAATWHSDNPYLVQASVLATADTFKAWLDDQDAKDKPAPVPRSQVFDPHNIVPPFDRRCPHCQAAPGQPCVTPSGSELMYHHLHRLEAPQPLPSRAGHPESKYPAGARPDPYQEAISTKPTEYGLPT